jgi:peptidoglycan/LPS O-acetylase OafA/YrhL
LLLDFQTAIFDRMVDMTLSVALFLALSGLLLARPLLRLAR